LTRIRSYKAQIKRAVKKLMVWKGWVKYYWSHQ